MKNSVALIALIAVAACGGTARAADTCLSLSQARAVNPNKYLVYYLDGGRRCWTPKMQHGATARHRGLPANTPPMPVAPRSTVLWPTLSLTPTTPVDAVLLTPEPATAWPRLLDIDEITGPVPAMRRMLLLAAAESRPSLNDGQW